MSPVMLEQQIKEIALQVRALITGRSGRLAAITVGTPSSVGPSVVESKLRDRLGRELREQVVIHVDTGDGGNLELLSLEFTWSR